MALCDSTNMSILNTHHHVFSHSLLLRDSRDRPASSVQHLLDTTFAATSTSEYSVLSWNTHVLLQRCLPDGTCTTAPADMSPSIHFPLPSSQTCLQLVAIIAVQDDLRLQTFVRGHSVRGTLQWFRCVGGTITTVAHLPPLNWTTAVYESLRSPSIPALDLPMHAPLPTTRPPHQDTMDEASHSDPDDSDDDLPVGPDAMMEDLPSALPTEVDASMWPDEPEPTNFVVQEAAMEYIAEANTRCTASINVLLCTLAELTAGKTQSTWVRDMSACITSRLPTSLPASDYIEAYLYTPHFPVVDTDHQHIPGCMPLSMYSQNGHSSGFVPVKRYLKEAIMDPEGTRPHDEQWTSFAFSVLLNSARNTDDRRPIVRRGLDHGLSEGSQMEYAERFGEHVIPELTYDGDNARLHINELCAAVKKYGWPTYFHTQTANMKHFPRLSEAYKEIEKRHLDVRIFLPYINRIWHRYVPSIQNNTVVHPKYMYQSPYHPSLPSLQPRFDSHLQH